MYKAMLLIVTFSSLLVAGGNLSFDENDKKVIYHTYNFEFDEAYDILNPLMGSNPDNLKYYFLELGIKSMMIEKSVYDETPDNKWELKKRLNEETIAYANKIVERFEDVEMSTENKFYMGCIYGYLGRMYGVTKSWMSAFSDGKTGRGLLEEVIEEDPEFHDAYLLLGMFNYYADRMGGFLGFVAGILGFSGDRETGIEYILKTYNKGYLLSDQAELLLIELYSGLEANGFDALPLHRKFVKKYPKNHQMLNWYVRDLLKYEYIDEAEKVLTSEKSDLIHPYHYADYFNKIGDYKKSNEFIKKIEDDLSGQHEYIMKRLAYMKKLNYFMMGEEDMYNSISVDEEYNILFNSLENEPQAAKDIIKLGFAVRKGDVSEAGKEILSKDPETKNKILDVIQSYFAGIYYYQQGELDSARKKFERIQFFDKEYLHYVATQYLIDIYRKIEVDKYKVENLVEEIDNMEYERLSYSVQDLVKKYNL